MRHLIWKYLGHLWALFRPYKACLDRKKKWRFNPFLSEYLVYEDKIGALLNISGDFCGLSFGHVGRCHRKHTQKEKSNFFFFF
ncbi:hypothetical protein EUGRSUZ_B00591 [Eucalyptus grandis]|uniref:Uncharacterized protein n=2 Tax=Eucalyptus grandis TaxID=71139 RepID=A0ACC3LMR6_EUCGR|nr:hypothetical protein EUGRSUZ_B00591 [Eucalyptus grandis]